MDYRSSANGCSACVKRLCDDSDEVLDFLFEKGGSGTRLFDSGDRITTVCLFVLKRLLTSLRADIAKALVDPRYNESELIQLLCRAGESQADAIRKYERQRCEWQTRPVGRGATSGASSGTYRINHNHHGQAIWSGRVNKSASPSDDGFSSDEGVARASNMTRGRQSEPKAAALADRSIQVSPGVVGVDDKATLTEQAAPKVDECCGSPLLTRSFGNQACLSTSSLDAGTNTDLPATVDGSSGVLMKDSALQVCLEMAPSFHASVNNESSSTDHSATHGNSSDLSAGQISFARAATHLIRTDCGLLVFNADGSLLAEELWRRGEDDSGQPLQPIHHPPSHSTSSKASSVRVMECEDVDAAMSGVEASLPSRLNFFYRPGKASGEKASIASSHGRRHPSVGSSTAETPVLLAKEVTIVSSYAEQSAAERAQVTQSNDTSIEEFGELKIEEVGSSTVPTGSAMIAEEEEEESTLNQVSPIPFG